MAWFIRAICAFCMCLAATTLPAQVLVNRIIIPPHPIPRPQPRPAEYKIESVEVRANVTDQRADVQFSQVFHNTGSQQLEAQLYFPLPDEATISGLTLLVDGKELAGKLLKKEEARKIYEETIRRQRDPALLEYIGQGLYRTSVFPVPAQGKRTVEVRYSQLLRKQDGLVSLLLPIGTTRHSHRPIDTMNIRVRIETTEPLKNIYSPTHQIDIQRPDDMHADCRLELKAVRSPDDLRILFGSQPGPVGLNVLSYRPSDSEPGYFALLASPDIQHRDAAPIDRTLVFVFDRSGSMTGKKFSQSQEALRFLIRQLHPGDVFNIVAYDSVVESFRPELQKVDEATLKAALGFVDGLYAGGSTNIDGALQTALQMLTDKNRPGYVLFMTDGLPTVGELHEQKIASHARDANKVDARLFCFGVGFDVNSRLLDRLSHSQRGVSVYVRPTENIETQVSSLYGKIGSPRLTNLSVTFELDRAAETDQPEITRTYPKEMTDLYQGEQLVYVGRYRHGGPAKVTLKGNLAGETKTFSTTVDLASKTSAGDARGFVEKLWATRRIGEIIDELDLKGHNQELVDELVQLSIKHGILTPYTSFLAEEDVRLADRESNVRRANDETLRQLSRASGKAGFSQRAYKMQLQNATTAGPASAASGLPELAIISQSQQQKVQTRGRKTFFQKNNQWQDATVTAEQTAQAIRIVQFSQEYFDLAAAHGGVLAKYIAFEEPVLVNLEGKTYQIVPETE